MAGLIPRVTAPLCKHSIIFAPRSQLYQKLKFKKNSKYSKQIITNRSAAAMDTQSPPTAAIFFGLLGSPDMLAI